MISVFRIRVRSNSVKPNENFQPEFIYKLVIVLKVRAKPGSLAVSKICKNNAKADQNICVTSVPFFIFLYIVILILLCLCRISVKSCKQRMQCNIKVDYTGGNILKRGYIKSSVKL